MKWRDKYEPPDCNDITPERGGCVVLWAIGCTLIALPLLALALGKLPPQHITPFIWLMLFTALVVAWCEKERNR